MRFAAAIFLLVLVLAPCLARLGMVGYFHLNRAEITRLHCVNKSKPELYCEGKCYLTEKLRKAEETERKLAELLLMKDGDFEVRPTGFPTFPGYSPERWKICTGDFFPKEKAALPGVFQPPEAEKFFC